MILRLSTYVETELPLDVELLKDILEYGVLECLKVNEKELQETILESISSFLKNKLNRPPKIPEKPNLSKVFKLLSKEEVIEKMRIKK